VLSNLHTLDVIIYKEAVIIGVTGNPAINLITKIINMKKALFLGLIVLQFINTSFSQIYPPRGRLFYIDTLHLRPLDSLMKINNPDSNCWVVAQPAKGRFNSPHSGKLAIITDSVHMYQKNLNDYFYMAISPPDQFWSAAMISFYHKYETDSLIDGGFIEISYNNGEEWINVHDDTLHAKISFIGLYTDTLKGGNYGFSGSSNGWQYVELYWLWYMLTKGSMEVFNGNPLIRFRFISDSINTNKEGWMIDDIVIRGYAPYGAVNKFEYGQITVYPNPSNGLVHINYPEKYSNTVKIEIFDIVGRLVKNEFPDHGQIDISNETPGIYFYKVYNFNDLLYSGKLTKY
jgi:hypothetical protein